MEESHRQSSAICNLTSVRHIQREPWSANSTIFQFSVIYIRDPTVIWCNSPTSIYNQQFVNSMWSEFATNKLYQRFDITEFASAFLTLLSERRSEWWERLNVVVFNDLDLFFNPMLVFDLRSIQRSGNCLRFTSCSLSSICYLSSFEQVIKSL